MEGCLKTPYRPRPSVELLFKVVLPDDDDEVWVLLEARVVSGSTWFELVLRALLLWKRFLRMASACCTLPFSMV